ncbi:primosomal protein N' [Aliarcobacter cryaerophilus]|uniref:Replication restart protein PriA n=3 Tax=unclassified Arcobacter TaxID=2593671 RepID=A0AA96L525_9BACT|nr:primosomal protein N' [Aliarcobacter cryaerophilus]WNL28225.1 primosomal protein N' [Arcobacter sp. AZ-2023]WPD04620.1 primosomal protein N' [Arcobacter sp. DSM 115956]WPD06715.1 primosomal protein N' [Arcobacter sp. DSM 115955]MCT7530613.1 primosomal protein N' [Aliarcobacter cryaerophilus]WNL30980.1 primosomal protein N' [Arcobacter sp. AZ-2023]
MNYYEVAILKSPLQNLTYQSEEIIENGSLVEVILANRKNSNLAVVIKKVDKPDFKCSTILSIKDEFYSDFMLQIGDFISKYYICSMGFALSLFQTFNKNIVYENSSIEYKKEITLSSFQQEAKDFLDSKKQALLFAKTGAGKTEIYIKTIKEILKQGKQAVFLMPEISLTPQMEKRLEEVFDSSVAIWHSKVTAKRKKEILNKLQNGDIKLIAGARSALFLPYNNLGLIIVDEEHDNSYKSDTTPRYNAKDLAIFIAKKFDLRLILGSATPSINSFYKIPYFELDKTFYETKKSYIFENSSQNISEKTINLIKKSIENKNQTIVFLPTRANFKHQICFDCGKSVECPFCSVSMSLHKNDLALKCHYCGFAQKIPEFCPSCKTGIVRNHRVGTAEIEELLKNEFPNSIIKRFDKDSVNSEKSLKKILDEFNQNKIDILVGTQMLSKGHDYHNVKLAVVLGMDSLLNMSSYKARENALSLLLQISGRSGRNGFGEVVIETKNEEFFKYYLEESNYKEFLKSELEFRKDLYPPFVKLARVVLSSTNGLKIKEELNEIVKDLKNNKDIEVVGFGECAIFKIANKYRYEVIIRSKDVKAILNALHYLKSSNISIDMDTIY